MSSALRVRGTVYLLGTGLLARLPQGMSALAIVRLVRDSGGGYGQASLLAAVFVAVGVVGQPLLARAVDQTGSPRIVLLASGTVTSAGFVVLGMAAARQPLVGLVAVAVAGAANPPVEPTLRALWTRMMRPGDQLRSAFGLDAAAQELLFIVGPLLSAGGIAVFGARGNVLAMATVGMLGVVALAAHPRLRPVPGRTSPTAGAVGPLARSSVLRRLVFVQLATGVPVGVLTISTTRFGELGNLPALGAWGLATNALGAFIGALVIARWPLHASPAVTIRCLLAGLAVLYVPTGLTGLPVWVWLTSTTLSGVLLPPLLTQVFSWTERAVIAEELTEANAWIVSAMTVGIAGGTAGAGTVVSALPGAGVIVAVAAGSLLAMAGTAAAQPAALRKHSAVGSSRVEHPSPPSG